MIESLLRTQTNQSRTWFRPALGGNPAAHGGGVAARRRLSRHGPSRRAPSSLLSGRVAWLHVHPTNESRSYRYLAQRALSHQKGRPFGRVGGGRQQHVVDLSTRDFCALFPNFLKSLEFQLVFLKEELTYYLPAATTIRNPNRYSDHYSGCTYHVRKRTAVRGPCTAVRYSGGYSRTTITANLAVPL